ncbi:MAG: FHA domain-containing protein, partial [Planctomycetota bacterium]
MAASDGKNRIVPLENYASVANDSAESFLAANPHPFLLLETKEGDFGDAGFQTLATTEPGAQPAEEKEPPEEFEATLADNDTETMTPEMGTTTDLDIPKTPVAEKHKQIKKKLDSAHRATYVCPLVKRDVNKFASMITVGRAANNDIRINLPSISKFHAYFTHVSSNDTWFVADANSSNGTFVNGERLKGEKTRVKLANGAAVRLGQDVALRFFEPKSFFEFLKTRLRGDKS